MQRVITKVHQGLLKILYRILDWFYLPLDRGYILRTRNIRHIPQASHRRGGKYAYAEWAHVIGIFQTLIYLELEDLPGNHILDIGCGTGLLGIACEPFLEQDGKYTGIDVIAEDITFNQSHFPPGKYDFIHLDTTNPLYAPAQPKQRLSWPLDSDSVDLATALSVWTHFREEDALFYLGEVARVLKPGGKAIITFFRLDDYYQQSLPIREPRESRFHSTKQDRWIFDQPAYGSQHWRCPSWAAIPESAIGIQDAGFDTLLASAGLEVEKYYPGTWKEISGLFFQDVVVFRNPT